VIRRDIFEYPHKMGEQSNPICYWTTISVSSRGLVLDFRSYKRGSLDKQIRSRMLKGIKTPQSDAADPVDSPSQALCMHPIIKSYH